MMSSLSALTLRRPPLKPSCPQRRERKVAAAAAPPPAPFRGEPGASPAADEASAAASDAPPASPPQQARLQATRLEHMDTLLLHKEPGGDMHQYRDLDQAESELGSFCSRLTAEEETEKCWQAYSYMERRREAATDSCDWTQPESCEDIEHLNDMVHNLMSTGSMDDLVATFSTLARVEEHRAARAAKQAEASEAEEDGAEQAAVDAAHVLFMKMDANGDGRLSLLEFQSAMSGTLGDCMDETTVALIGDAMDLHDGFLTEQQFRDVVEAEAINSQSMLAKLLRRGGRSRLA